MTTTYEIPETHALTILARHLDSFDLDQIERGIVFEAYDLAPAVDAVREAFFATEPDSRHPALRAWAAARLVPLRLPARLTDAETRRIDSLPIEERLEARRKSLRYQEPPEGRSKLLGDLLPNENLPTKLDYIFMLSDYLTEQEQ